MKKRQSFLALIIALMIFLPGCGYKRVTKELDITTFGIDVARYQGTIDWQKVADSGVDFAMVRLGYRGIVDGEIKPDSNGRYNLQEASKVGIRLGAYFFSTAISKEEAIEEARWVADVLKGYPITYPVGYDCEGFEDTDSRQYGMSKSERTDIALAFLKEIERLGYEGIFYASKNMMEMDAKWIVSRIERDYKIWVAQYPELPYPMTAASSYSRVHHMWQYSMEGAISGVRQKVDLNVAYFGYDGIEPARDKTPPETVGPDVEAMMSFTEVYEEVTAKEETNLRSIPSTDEDSQVLYTLKHGEAAQRIAVSSNGWSKLIFNGQTYYALTNYLVLTSGGIPEWQKDPDGIQTEFTAVDDRVTAKELVNLRLLPSVEHEGATVIAQLKNGEVATRTGISANGWSRLEYNGTVCYAVTNYLMVADGDEPTESKGADGIQTTFEDVYEEVTAKKEVNLRNIPSVDHPDTKVVFKLYHGDVAIRTGINRDLGWSRVEYKGQTLYCVSSYIKTIP